MLLNEIRMEKRTVACFGAKIFFPEIFLHAMGNFIRRAYMESKLTIIIFLCPLKALYI